MIQLLWIWQCILVVCPFKEFFDYLESFLKLHCTIEYRPKGFRYGEIEIEDRMQAKKVLDTAKWNRGYFLVFLRQSIICKNNGKTYHICESPFAIGKKLVSMLNQQKFELSRLHYLRLNDQIIQAFWDLKDVIRPILSNKNITFRSLFSSAKVFLFSSGSRFGIDAALSWHWMTIIPNLGLLHNC